MENLNIIQDNNIPKKQNKTQNVIFGILITILIILIIVLFTFVFICAPVKIKGDSMKPSLNDGDIIMISKVHKEPVLGDIVVYQKPNEKNITVIKRVIAVEGDVLYFGTKPTGINVLTKKDDPNNQEYSLTPSQYQFLTTTYGMSVTIKKGEVFTIGDNVLNSIDGRNYGTIPISAIIGIKLG